MCEAKIGIHGVVIVIVIGALLTYRVVLERQAPSAWYQRVGSD